MMFFMEQRDEPKQSESKRSEPKRGEQKRPQHPALEIIEEAMKRGDFDNLPGKGKPLNLDPKEFTDPLAFTNRLRKNANIGTPWEELQREIEHDQARAERDITDAFARRNSALLRGIRNPSVVENEWLAALSTFQHRVGELNRKVLSFNLLLPRALPHLYKKRLDAGAILKRLGIEIAEDG